VAEVGILLFLRDVGFSLGEVAELVGAAGKTAAGWDALVDRKLAELDAQQHQLEIARTALEHARKCPEGHPARCPRFWSIIESRAVGLSLEESHAALHAAAHASRAQ
jgi:hypothetical protein